MGAGANVHALRPEDDEEDPDEGEDDDNGRPGEVAEPGAVRGDAQVAAQDGQLDQTRGEEEQRLRGNGDLPPLDDLPWLEIPDVEVPAIQLSREDDTDGHRRSEYLSEGVSKLENPRFHGSPVSLTAAPTMSQSSHHVFRTITSRTYNRRARHIRARGRNVSSTIRRASPRSSGST